LHGGTDDRKLVLPTDPAIKPQLIDLLRSWTEVVIASQVGERSQLCDVSNAIGRLGFRELLPELKRLLDEDLARLDRAIDARSEALRRGDIRASSDAAHRYDNQYREALTRIGGEDVAAVAGQYLENPMFALDATTILKALSDKQLNAPEPTFWRQWPWFDGVDVARRARAAVPPRAPANVFADPIFTAIDRLAKPENKNTEQLLAIELVRVALTMPHSGQDELITRVGLCTVRVQARVRYPKYFASGARHFWGPVAAIRQYLA
jgi:hypothetical protein